MDTLVPKGRVRVQARVWGASDADADTALRQAQRGWGRGAWDFGDVERLVGGACPLNVRDRTALAAEQGNDWAYVVHRGAA